MSNYAWWCNSLRLAIKLNCIMNRSVTEMNVANVLLWCKNEKTGVSRVIENWLKNTPQNYSFRITDPFIFHNATSLFPFILILFSAFILSLFCSFITVLFRLVTLINISINFIEHKLGHFSDLASVDSADSFKIVYIYHLFNKKFLSPHNH